MDENGVAGGEGAELVDGGEWFPAVGFGAGGSGGAVGERGGDGLAFADEVGEDLEEVGVGHAGEQDAGDVIVEDGAGVVSSPPADDLAVVLEDGHELDVAGAKGGGVLGELGDGGGVGGLVE